MAYETTHVVVDLGDPVPWDLASTGRRDGRWVYSTFQMAEDRADHFALRHDGDEPQSPALTPRAVHQLQRKHPLEQPRPAPARRPGARLWLVEAWLTWRGDDALAQMAVRRQAPPIAHQMDAGQGDRSCTRWLRIII